MKKLLILTVGVSAMFLTSCAPTTLYFWGGNFFGNNDYQSVTYNYVKENTDASADELLLAYRQMIDHTGGLRRVVPPGIYADYGFLLYKQGKKDDAIKYMKMEIELYPESSVFIHRIIKQLEQ